MFALQMSGTIEQVQKCISCGIVFGFDEYVRKQRAKDQTSFYCPNGHTQSYCGETEEQKLRRQLESQKSETQRYRERYNKEVNRVTVYKGHLTKTKNRIKNGACPCCKRSFINLQRHMKTQHPTYGSPNSI